MFRNTFSSLPCGVKASLALFFANVVTKGIAYISTPLYTRMLSAEEYGQVSVFLTWEQVFGIVAMFCLSAGVFNNGMLDYQDRRDEYSFSMLILSNLITICFFGTLLYLYPFLKAWIGLDWLFMLLMGGLFLLQPAYNFWTGRQRYELKYKASTAWTIALACLSPAVALICILCFRRSRLYARIFGAYIPLLLIYIGFYIYLAVKAHGKVKIKYWKEAFLFNLPLIPHYLSTNLLGSADKLMISRLVGDTATAYYSVAYSVASVATIVWTAVNASLIPYTYEKCKEEDYHAVSVVTLPILTFFAVVCLLVVLFAPEVVAVMARADYAEAVYAIPPVVGGVFFQVQYFIYANIVYYYKKPKYVMYASVSSVALNIFLNFICISRFGYIAAGYTTFVCYFLQVVLDYLAMRKVVGRFVYDMRYLGLLSACMTAAVLLSSLLYGYAILRYAIIVLILVAGIRNRKRLIKLLTDLKSDMVKGRDRI